LVTAASNTPSGAERVLEARPMKPCSNKLMGKGGVTGDVYDFLSRLKKTDTNKLAKSLLYLIVPQIKFMVSQQGRCLYGPLRHLTNKRFDREKSL